MTGFSATQKAELSRDLDASRVKRRKGSGGNFDYLEAWDVMNRANQVFGFDGWSSETVLLKETWSGGRRDKAGCSYIAKVRVTVFAGERQIVREGVGYGDGDGHDLGKATELAVKEAESDAFKRAMRSFGMPFGLALYDKDQGFVRRGADDEPLEVEEEMREAEQKPETRSDFPGDRPSSAGSIREKVERKVEEKKRAAEPDDAAFFKPQVFEWKEPTGDRDERETYWRGWSRQFAPAIRACKSHEAALALINANKEGLTEYGAELRCDALGMVRDIADKHFGVAAQEESREPERESAREEDGNYIPEPDNENYDDWDKWMDLMLAAINASPDRAEALKILDANDAALKIAKRIIDIDAREYFEGKITAKHGSVAAKARARSRSDGKTARGR
ncbi:MAG: RAD52 family DNA repair protein [Hyphomonadaceae bacterium]